MSRFFFRYLLPRIGQFLVVLFLGITVTYIIPRLSPNDPVEQQVSQIMMSGAQFTPEAIEHMREVLGDLYGLQGTQWEQYIGFWGRLFRGDLGPSLSRFPTASRLSWRCCLKARRVLSWLVVRA